MHAAIHRMLVVLVPVLLVLGARTARAGDPPIRKPTAAAALAHLSQGNKLYAIRAFEQAASEYKAGAVVEGAPIFDYNLGQCYRQLAQYKDAIWHYQRFLNASPETPDHATVVRKFITEMQGELDRPPLITAPVKTDPPKTEPKTEPKTALNTEPKTEPQESPSHTDLLGWGLAGVGGVGIGVSIGLFVSARSSNDDANTATSQQESNRLHDQADTRALAATIVGVGGVGLLVAGVIKLIRDPRSHERSRAVGVGVSWNGIFVFGGF